MEMRRFLFSGAPRIAAVLVAVAAMASACGGGDDAIDGPPVTPRKARQRQG